MHHASTPTIYWYTYATRWMRPLLCADFIPIIEKDIKLEALVVTCETVEAWWTVAFEYMINKLDLYNN